MMQQCELYELCVLLAVLITGRVIFVFQEEEEEAVALAKSRKSCC